MRKNKQDISILWTVVSLSYAVLLYNAINIILRDTLLKKHVNKVAYIYIITFFWGEKNPLIT